MRSISLLANGLLFTTHTRALTAAYSPSTSDAMATRPKMAAAPPTYCRLVATGLATKARTPEGVKQGKGLFFFGKASV